MGKGFSVSFENEGRGMLFGGEGVLSGEQLIKNARHTYSPEVLQRLRYQIVDLRGVERMDITSEQMQCLAEMDRKAAEYSSGTRIAIVASHDLTVALGRIYSAYAQSPKLETNVFPTMEAARAWIGHEPSAPQAEASAH